MKRYIIFALVLSFCAQENSLPNTQTISSPELYINCNYIDDTESVSIEIKIEIFSNSEKLVNGSLKGIGLANGYYKQLDDISINSSFKGEYIFISDSNGTFSFILYYDGEKSYRADCNNEVNSITTTTTRPKQTTTTTTTRPKQTTTTTTRPKQTTTTTTTTTTPYINYKTYTLRSLEMFLEVGFSGIGDVVRRFEPTDGTIYISTNGAQDDGLTNYVKTIPNMFKELDLNISFEFKEGDNVYDDNELEVWYSITNYTNDFLYAETCRKNYAITYATTYETIDGIRKIIKAQTNICVSGNGFDKKKAWTLQGVTTQLGFDDFEPGSQYAGYGGYLQPKFAKNKEIWNDDDKLLIQILYDPRVYNGMSKGEFKEIFKLP